MILQVRDMKVRYGAIHALHGIDLEIAPNEVVALIGANGAGKSSAVKAIAGLLPYSGEVVYDGAPLRPAGAERNVRKGLVLVPEGRGILGGMSVEENLLMGIYSRPDQKAAQADVEAMMERFPILGERRHGKASLLSGGEQQMLAIARALLARPRLLLLDEPSLGLAPKMTSFVFDLIGSLRRDGLSVLLVEQKARQALKISDRAYLLETGRIVASGSAESLANDDVVSETFLGGRVQAGSENTQHR
ncbi:ABC transporter ATP-binding protein [Microbaculum marinum]|uniref:ABC transporter ATP-binding protein n=1 Tax=Microbaculum marinum TaxID=1764581 RepID=A0AAW9RLH3_9HYPH